MAETALGVLRCPACGATRLGCWPVTVDAEAFLCGECGEPVGRQLGPARVLAHDDPVHVGRVVREAVRALDRLRVPRES